VEFCEIFMKSWVDFVSVKLLKVKKSNNAFIITIIVFLMCIFGNRICLACIVVILCVFAVSYGYLL
jgi:hypothetical protein